MQRRTLANLLGALALSLACGATAADADGSFTERDLTHLLANARGGVIYLWSPHMPYSVRGAMEAKRLLDGLGLRSVLLLDPLAEPALASRVRRAHGLPDSAMRRMRAGTLWRMGVTQHYPTAVVFAGGQLDTQMLPGYTPPGELHAYVHQRLQNF